MERLLRPGSVAVIGASATPGALGASVIANLERLKFSGDIYLVNPNRDAIGSRLCLKSIEELPSGIDVAVLAIPRVAVLNAVKALASRQVGAVIIFSAGFAEGGEAGLADQRELARIAKYAGMIIEGPNCLGLVNYVEGIALTFVETAAVASGSRPGIGIVSQSGALAAVVAVTLFSKGLGVSYSISTGNEAASGVEDYVEYLLDDRHTHVIALVVEQFRKPKRFLDLARLARERGKSIVLLHPGRSRAARDSAATHTGAMAGDYSVMRTQVQHAGVVLADNLEEFGDVLDIISRCPARPSGGAVVLAESGAFKALALDLCEEIGLPLPVLTDQSAPAL
ncbi:MAG TPA: CoA-binding protein, partial [Steroidobacteraceae bacterium]|nr:CoA-binding protein [Steroidobacteraceae bacterium]